MKFAPIGLMLLCCLTLVAQVPPQDQSFDSDGVRIRYVDHGQGEPIILIHGFTGRLEGWNRGDILPSLARDYRVVALDCRGHGLSDKPHDPEMYGSRMADDVLRLMDHLGIRKAHVVGYSMGARITGYLLAKHSDRMITATLGGSPPRRTWNQADIQRSQDFSARQRALSEEDDGGTQDRIALAAIPLAWQSQVVKDEELAAAGVPTLSIVGSEDSRVTGMKALKTVIPSLELVVIDGATHGSALRSPEFLQSLKEFIARNSGGD